jgi:hypothetical protein
MTDREQWEELAFFELANGDGDDLLREDGDDPDDDFFPDEDWEDLDEDK